MDPKMKTALAVVAGAVIGVTLLGGLFAAHAVMGTVAFAGRAAGPGSPMMGQRQGFDECQGMMGPRGQGGAPGTFGGCPDGAMGQDGACPNTGGMMGAPRGGCQQAPQDGTGACPNGEACPGATPDATTES